MLPPNDFFIRLPIADEPPGRKTSILLIMIHEFRGVSGSFQGKSEEVYLSGNKQLVCFNQQQHL